MPAKPILLPTPTPADPPAPSRAQRRAATSGRPPPDPARDRGRAVETPSRWNRAATRRGK